MSLRQSLHLSRSRGTLPGVTTDVIKTILAPRKEESSPSGEVAFIDRTVRAYEHSLKLARDVFHRWYARRALDDVATTLNSIADEVPEMTGMARSIHGFG